MNELLWHVGRAFVDAWIDLGECGHAPGDSLEPLIARFRPDRQAAPSRVPLLPSAPSAQQREVERAVQRLAPGMTVELRTALGLYFDEFLSAWASRPPLSALEIEDLLPDPFFFYPPHRWARIVQAGQLYSTINETDALDWPNPLLKERGGRRGWNSFYPHNGNEGRVIGQSTHRGSGVMVYFLALEGYIAPMGESGLHFPNEQAAT